MVSIHFWLRKTCPNISLRRTSFCARASNISAQLATDIQILAEDTDRRYLRRKYPTERTHAQLTY